MRDDQVTLRCCRGDGALELHVRFLLVVVLVIRCLCDVGADPPASLLGEDPLRLGWPAPRRRFVELGLSLPRTRSPKPHPWPRLERDL